MQVVRALLQLRETAGRTARGVGWQPHGGPPRREPGGLEDH